MREKYVFFESKLGITSFILFIVGFGLFVFGELSYGLDVGMFEIIITYIIIFVGSILFLSILYRFLTSVRTIIPYILLTLPYLVVCIIRLVEIIPYFYELYTAIGLISGGVLLITFLVIFILFSRTTIGTELEEKEIIVQPVKIIPSSSKSKTISPDMLIQVISLVLMLTILLFVWFSMQIIPFQLVAIFLYLSGHILTLRYLGENYNWIFNLILSIFSVILFAFLVPDLVTNEDVVSYRIGLGSLIIGNLIILIFSFLRTVKEKKTESVDEKDA